MNISRRGLFKVSSACALVNYSIPFTWATELTDELTLIAQETTENWFGDNNKTNVWGYSMAAIRLQKNIPVKIMVHNQLTEATSVHWHGMRIDNDMDGVSGLTQKPIEAGEKFAYHFMPKDAGTFWAHSHHDTYRQLALGLYVPIIVQETVPYAVDQDLLFVADDWLLNSNDQIDSDSFEDTHAWSHGGRMGNFLSINRQRQPEFSVFAGQRLRLRVMNTANSRILSFGFPDTAVSIIAKDGQPFAEPVVLDRVLTIVPAERYDLVVDIPNNWEGLFPIYERSGKQPFLAAKWSVTKTVAVKNQVSIAALPPNPLPPKDFKIKHRLTLDMQGGAMGNLKAATYQGKKHSVNELLANKQVWTFNGIANMPEQPFASLAVGEGIEIELFNGTRWPHAMHLHGHHFLTKNSYVGGDIWQDTTLVEPGESIKIRFVAETVGKWLLHCHMIEHQVSGMVTYIEVEA